MSKAKKISEFYNFGKNKIEKGKSTIICDNGQCGISSDTDIMGIEINFRGRAKITPKLPSGWYLRGNKRKMIIFTMQNVPIKDSLLFEYEGYVKIDSIIVANSEGKQIFCTINKNAPNWINNTWQYSLEGDTWDNFKDKIRKGAVNKTSYIIDDDLPKVEKTKITKTKFRKRVDTSTPTQGGGSSGSSGGGY